MQKILVLRGGALGDFIVTLPALAGLIAAAVHMGRQILVLDIDRPELSVTFGQDDDVARAGLDHRFDDLLAREPDVERGGAEFLELAFETERCERRDRDQHALAVVESLAAPQLAVTVADG